MESIITKPAFKVIGISVRTCNRDIEQVIKDLGGLWQRFFAEDIMQKIPAPLRQDIYQVYTNYEGDYLEPYDSILGCVVAMDAVVPEGLVEKIIPEQKYQIFCAKGKLPDVVGATWGEIWQTPLSRNYIADFDVYGAKSQNPEQDEVDIYVGIK